MAAQRRKLGGDCLKVRCIQPNGRDTLSLTRIGTF
jgi:hypothetical protein